MSRLKELLAAYPERDYRLEGNTFVVPEARLLYMDTPKTAGTAIKTALMEMGGTNVNDLPGSWSAESTPEMTVHDRGLNPVKSLTDVPDDVAEAALTSPDWMRVCVVRHPITRLFSAWYSKVLLREPHYVQKLGDEAPALPDRLDSVDEISSLFKTFVRFLETDEAVRTADAHWAAQWWLLFGDEIDWSVVARYEHLAADWSPVVRHVALSGLEMPALPRANVSGMQIRGDGLDAGTTSTIRSLYEDDFEHFGYSPSLPVETETGRADDEGDGVLLHVNSTIGRNRRIEELHTFLSEASERLAQSTEELDACREHAARLERDLLDHQAMLEEVFASRSWRVTAPLRTPRGWADRWRSRGHRD